MGSWSGERSKGEKIVRMRTTLFSLLLFRQFLKTKNKKQKIEFYDFLGVCRTVDFLRVSSSFWGSSNVKNPPFFTDSRPNKYCENDPPSGVAPSPKSKKNETAISASFTSDHRKPSKQFNARLHPCKRSRVSKIGVWDFFAGVENPKITFRAHPNGR